MSSSKNSPRFTVIVPTKDRATFTHHTLRTCALQDYDNLEVIVSDDGSTDDTRQVVEDAARRDPRIRYVTPRDGGVGMRDNFEFALAQVKPGFVLALGGDDGLLPGGIQGMLDVLMETGQELLTWPTPVYVYPGARTTSGQLQIPRQRGSRIVHSAEYLRRQARTLSYTTDVETPMFYVKGVASTTLVERVRSRSPDRRFYQCPTPDGYSGIVLAGEVETYAFSGEPFSLHGVSPSSQGMAYLSGSEQARKRSEAFFRDVAQKPMHSQLASQQYSPLITLMTADYLLSAQDLAGWPGHVPEIDYRNLLENGLRELSHGLFSADRVPRELAILARIAEQHGLGAFFRERVKKARRYASKAPLEGNAISREILFLDPVLYAIKNVFDAAYVARYVHKILPTLGISGLVAMLVNSISYRLRSVRKGGAFPPESEWHDAMPPLVRRGEG